MQANSSETRTEQQVLYRVQPLLLGVFVLGFLAIAIFVWLWNEERRLRTELIVLAVAFCMSFTIWLTLLIAAKENRKQYVRLIGLSLLALLLLIFSGAVMDVFYRAALGGITYFAATLLSRRLGISWLTIFLSVLAPELVLFNTGVGDAAFQPIGWMPVIGFALAMAVAYSRRWLSALLSLGLIGFLSFVCYPNYWNYLEKQPIPAGNRLVQNRFISSSNDTLNVMALPQKVVLLDLWYSRCGVCFQTMPETQKLYERYKNDPDVLIAAVNVPMKEDSADAAWSLLSKYSLPKFKSLGDLKANPWGVQGYPMAIIFDKDRKVRYLGQLEFNPVVRDNVYALVERLKGG